MSSPARLQAMRAPAGAPPEGRIGPNAVTRLAEALEERLGVLPANEVFRAAGQLHLRHAPPASMVDERVVTALHAALRRELPPAEAARIARRAGELTGDYLLANRIPAPARLLLRLLPAPASARMLVRAMARHAWTFAGSGEFSADFGGGPAGEEPPGSPAPRLRLTVAGCPLCRGAATAAPVCDYFAATFERLFRSLASRSATVRESACHATGAPACRFEVRW